MIESLSSASVKKKKKAGAFGTQKKQDILFVTLA